jgi:hypothetical protein
MICSDVGKVLVPVPDSDNMKHRCPTSKNSYKILPFEYQNQHCFPESLLLIIFCLFDQDPNLVPEPDPELEP